MPTGPMNTPVQESIDQLRSSLAGAVLGPADPEYERHAGASMLSSPPARGDRALCRRRDVAIAFDFARTHRLEVAVRGGGHNPAGHCVWTTARDRSLGMRGVDVDADPGVARASGGATWLDFDSADAGPRPCYAGGRRRLDRRRAGSPRRRHRPTDSPTRPDVRQPGRCRVVTPDGSWSKRLPMRTPNSSGGSAAGAGTSALRRDSTSACMLSKPSSEDCSPSAGRASAMLSAATATSRRIPARPELRGGNRG